MKRYRDYSSYLKEMFGERVQKIPLDAGLGCPNRDGTISYEGCVYCDSKGSGTGAMSNHGQSISDQVSMGCEFAKRRYRARKFIAYFQSFTNTYAPVDKLRDLYDEALSHPGMVGLSVATRPDCIGDEVLSLLDSYTKDYLVWVEYGLQSAHDQTLLRINRGHDVACFEQSVYASAERGLNICAHVILGLPGETRQMMLDSARYLGGLPLHGVKIHLLYVVQDSPIAALYKRGEFRCLQRDEYVELVVDFLELLPPGMIIHRLTGDPFGSQLLAPEWAKDKSRNLSLIRRRLEERDTWQGKRYQGSIAGKQKLRN
ncbi:MAG: TIGR01212 family radical SAM protein [Deltaproteobacteria bacterium]|nr:TIGR01212 family radical SAM protein [Deltaproteobacteria bacterium]MBW1920673.1 TIGR01212 family radical SAM protein [Deltaproteobacteria bacterium]MBW1935185.1 TIGR01212 family radical SAM protein [Deltaproteobacteria bacterium]MBW2044002.1 TIGR01212 family radical SAM protein [Deltaproteobacteria bacterium]RLB34211.1 MAG: TIGR01212 family radical SAM protein [Deltaproteobacteria bacterium]